MKALHRLFLFAILAFFQNKDSFSQIQYNPDSINVTKASADTIEAIHQDYSPTKGDPLKPGNIYYFSSYTYGNQVGEILKIDSNSITIKNHDFEVLKLKKQKLTGIYNIMTNSVFLHTKPHRADITLSTGTTYTDAKIQKLRKDSLIVKISSGIVSIPVVQIQNIDFDETPPLISNSREIVYLIMFWPLLPLCLMDPGLNTDFDLSKMDLKWKNAMLRCLISYHYPGRFVDCDPRKY
jgi:hypothetical protein